METPRTSRSIKGYVRKYIGSLCILLGLQNQDDQSDVDVDNRRQELIVVFLDE